MKGPQPPLHLNSNSRSSNRVSKLAENWLGVSRHFIPLDIQPRPLGLLLLSVICPYNSYNSNISSDNDNSKQQVAGSSSGSCSCSCSAGATPQK